MRDLFRDFLVFDQLNVTCGSLGPRHGDVGTGDGGFGGYIDTGAGVSRGGGIFSNEPCTR